MIQLALKVKNCNSFFDNVMICCLCIQSKCWTQIQTSYPLYLYSAVWAVGGADDWDPEWFVGLPPPAPGDTGTAWLFRFNMIFWGGSPLFEWSFLLLLLLLTLFWALELLAGVRSWAAACLSGHFFSWPSLL